MKKLCYESLRTVSVVFLMICLTASSAYSGIVFEAGFRGPGSGKNGPYDMVNIGGSGYVFDDTENRTLPGVIIDNPMTVDNSYLSCVVTNPTHLGGVSMVKFIPESAATSLDAMTDVVNGDRVINGGFDFFFRTDTALISGEMRNMDESNTGNGGLRFVFTSQSTGGNPGLRLEIISNNDGLFSGSEGGGLSKFQSASGAFTIESNTVYHIGVSYATDSEGTVTAKIWGQEGTGAIDLSTATPVGSTTFGINEAVTTSGFKSTEYGFGGLRFSNISFDEMIQEYDQFRIYDETPTIFGALEKTAVTWRDSAPETVLQADFNGAGSGTGGDDDIMTLGGTATLIDGGNDSDASVFYSDPFVVSGSSSSGGYLNVVTTNYSASTTVHGRTAITPSSPASSLDSMTVMTNGHLVLRGGVDFFFRNLRDISTQAEFRPFDTDNRGAGGLRVVLFNDSASQLKLEVISNTDDDGLPDGLYTGGEGGATARSLGYVFPAHIESNTIYHVGLSFDGIETGDVTATIWFKEGTDAIDLRADLPVGSLTFGVNESVVTNGLTSGTFSFGKLRSNGDIPSTQEFDCFRIYNDTPLNFDALTVPSGGTILMVN